MLRISMLFLSMCACVLSVSSGAEAVKQNSKEIEGPMDRFLQRKPLYPNKPAKEKKSASKKAKSSKKNPLDPKTQRYVMAMLGEEDDLTPMERAWLSKF